MAEEESVSMTNPKCAVATETFSSQVDFGYTRVIHTAVIKFGFIYKLSKMRFKVKLNWWLFA